MYEHSTYSLHREWAAGSGMGLPSKWGSRKLHPFFHRNCLIDWANSRPGTLFNCPECRATITSIQFRRIDADDIQPPLQARGIQKVKLVCKKVLKGYYATGKFIAYKICLPMAKGAFWTGLMTAWIYFLSSEIFSNLASLKIDRNTLTGLKIAVLAGSAMGAVISLVKNSDFDNYIFSQESRLQISIARLIMIKRAFGVAKVCLMFLACDLTLRMLSRWILNCEFGLVQIFCNWHPHPYYKDFLEGGICGAVLALMDN